MTRIMCRTKGNSSPKGKPRVFFTCHPEDFDGCFDKICNDIFLVHDCAIYYTEDMTELIEEQNLETDLESNNLLVIPVTFKLLTTPNRAMDFDVQFAKEKHIPILPFLMESGLDFWYSKQDKFGEMQYLDPFSTDLTAISYEEKLKKYLGTVLVDDETAKKVRAAFDAYIFLSYRKKDRHLANKLMRIIHSNPEYRDIAIWFDEFLTPGESFRENINKALSDSKLFTLLVTPNLLEENNFVMREEYPAAVASGIGILPAEMEKTDRETLEAKYENIPECAVTEDEIAFRDRLLVEVEKLSIRENNTPEHNYLIGLAYLEGIDVEVDRERGIELITSAAEAEYPEAIEKLYSMYDGGIHVGLNYDKALYWIKKLVDIYFSKYGQNDVNTIFAQHRLASACGKVGNYGMQLELNEQLYHLRCRILGENHIDTVNSLSNLAVSYCNIGDYKKALELNIKVYSACCETLGKEHKSSLIALNNLATGYLNLGDYKKALEVSNECCELARNVLGDHHANTILFLVTLSVIHRRMVEYTEALEVCSFAYELSCSALGEEHPITLNVLGHLSISYMDAGNAQKSAELGKKSYELNCKVFGNEHPNTINALANLALHYNSVELNQRAYGLYCKVLGKEHPLSLISCCNLAVAYCGVEEYEKALELFEKVYADRCRIFGDDCRENLDCLVYLAFVYGKVGRLEDKLDINKKSYELHKNIYGEKHPDTLTVLNNLAFTYGQIGDYNMAIELYKKFLPLSTEVWGEDNPKTEKARLRIEEYEMMLGDTE